MMENIGEAGWAAVDIMRRESDGPTEAIAAAIQRLEEHLADVPRPPATEAAAGSPVVTTRFRLGDQLVTTVTTIVRFDVARDVTLKFIEDLPSAFAMMVGIAPETVT